METSDSNRNSRNKKYKIKKIELNKTIIISKKNCFLFSKIRLGKKLTHAK